MIENQPKETHMKKSVIAVSLISALLLGGWASAADNATSQKQTICPVMGGKINTNQFVDAGGKRIYVCCKGCLPELKQDSAKFIQKLERQGIVLDKAPPAAKK